MSIDTLTGDDFARLDATDHRVAIEQYELAVETVTHNLGHRVHADPASREADLDRLGSLLQLRKLHKQRLGELEEDEQPAGVPATEQYYRNEQLAPAA